MIRMFVQRYPRVVPTRLMLRRLLFPPATSIAPAACLGSLQVGGSSRPITERGRIAALVEYRDGTVIDVVRQVL
jgi:hypothetical protein